jgi:hypothetical protein
MFYLGRVLSIASQSCDSKMIVSKIAEIITKYQNDGLVAIFNPEVSWVRPLLEGMVGFPSPFESLRTILWD